MKESSSCAYFQPTPDEPASTILNNPKRSQAAPQRKDDYDGWINLKVSQRIAANRMDSAFHKAEAVIGHDLHFIVQWCTRVFMFFLYPPPPSSSSSFSSTATVIGEKWVSIGHGNSAGHVSPSEPVWMPHWLHSTSLVSLAGFSEILRDSLRFVSPPSRWLFACSVRRFIRCQCHLLHVAVQFIWDSSMFIIIIIVVVFVVISFQFIEFFF